MYVYKIGTYKGINSVKNKLLDTHEVLNFLIKKDKGLV
jgi:hypothetical protein